MEEDTYHLGIFRANSNEAKILIDRYGHHFEMDEFFVWLDEVKELPYIPTIRDPNAPTDDYPDVYYADCPNLASITDRNDPRLTSREYFVVPFGYHR